MTLKAQVFLKKLRSKDQREYLFAAQQSLRSIEPWIGIPTSPKSFTKFVREVSSPSDRAYLIRRASDNTLVGVVEIRDIFKGYFKCGYLIYYAFDGFRGQGYMKEGLTLAIQKAFQKLKLHRLEANIQPSNHSSIGLAKSVGLKYEGYSPKFLKINGAWQDHERWALINDKLS
jgi:[ribosomal protein S5]-alanine N-acetyltransferase